MRMFFAPSGAFQGRLGDTHNIVSRHDFLGSVIGHGHDRPAAGAFHERDCSPGDSQECVHGDIDGIEECSPWGLHEVAPGEPLAFGKGDGMDEHMKGIVLLGKLGEDLVDLFVTACIERCKPRVVDLEGFDSSLGAAFVFVARQVGEGASTAVVGEGLGDVPGVGAFVGDADDEGGFAFEQGHGVLRWWFGY